MPAQGTKANPVQDPDGMNYLKISSTNQIINKLICGCSKRNASLSGSAKLQELKSMRNSQLGLGPHGAGCIDDAENEEEQAGDCIGGQKKKHKGQSIIVNICVDGTDCSILCPPKRVANSDLVVKIDPEMLNAIFTYIQEDCQNNSSSRSYRKTGLFRKAGGKATQEGSESEG